MKILLKARDFILQQKEELALIETLESGKPISQARDEVDWTADLWQYAASLCRNIHGDTYTTLGDSMWFRRPSWGPANLASGGGYDVLHRLY